MQVPMYMETIYGRGDTANQGGNNNVFNKWNDENMFFLWDNMKLDYNGTS